MTVDELSRRANVFFDGVVERLEGVGAEQYSAGSTQLFETMPLGKLETYMREELQDVAAYALMLSIRLDRLVEGIRKRWQNPPNEKS